MSYSELQHQKNFLVLRPVSSVTAVDLKQAPGTALCTFHFPKDWGRVQLIKMGGNVLTAGGAVTVNGKAKLQVAGADVEDEDANDLTLSWGGANLAAHEAIEADLNQYTGDFGAKQYETALYNKKIEMLVHTEGTGAGSQSFHPYLIVRIDPSYNG